MSVPQKITPVPFETADLKDASFLPRTATEMLYAEFNKTIQAVIGNAVIHPTFDIETTQAQLHEHIDQVTPHLVSRVLEREAKYISGDKPLHAFLGDLALVSDANATLVPDETFVSDVHTQVTRDQEHLIEVAELHAKWPVETFEALQTISELIASGTTEDADKVFEIVKAMSENPEDFTLDPNDSEGLYLITFLPRKVRQVARRMLVGNHITAKIASELGVAATEEESEMLTLLGHYYQLDNLTDQLWKDVPISEKTVIQQALLSTKLKATLARLQELSETEAAVGFKAIWQSVTRELREQIDEMGHNSKVSHWQATDTGHAFGGFWTHELLRAFQLGVYSPDKAKDSNRYTQPKNGMRAAILEDDPQQRQAWQEAVEGLTIYTTDPTSSVETVEEFKKLIGDKSVGLYIIDIQNGDDLTAGIRMGEAVLRDRVEAIKNAQNPAELPFTQIIVWSASKEAVQVATEHFTSIVKELSSHEAGISYSLGGVGSSGGNRVSIKTSLKNWSAYRDIAR